LVTYKWTQESLIEINAKSSVHPIHGETHDITGEVSGEVEDGKLIKLDPMPKAYIEASTDTLKTGKKLEDMEMRRRIEAKKFPTIRLDFKEASGGPDKFHLKCSLTFHGVTRDFEEDATARLENGALYIEGEHTFNIEDFGVTAPKIMSMKVYPDVTIVAHLVGRPA